MAQRLPEALRGFPLARKPSVPMDRASVGIHLDEADTLPSGSVKDALRPALPVPSIGALMMPRSRISFTASSRSETAMVTRKCPARTRSSRT